MIIQFANYVPDFILINAFTFTSCESDEASYKRVLLKLLEFR